MKRTVCGLMIVGLLFVFGRIESANQLQLPEHSNQLLACGNPLICGGGGGAGGLKGPVRW
ncbi:hypothetical protein [Herpetosiphon gulosus]|uniref:Uncharacterized protein n=1 Tax=Herpetosiphon gulosus TaxID=1973496 RepID=A0ABP9WY30_9CHLR